MTRRQLTSSALATLAPRLHAREKRPHIILILADDMGWGDPSCYGNTAIKTPHIDSLARDGVKFENFYSASAVCSPSRAAILTGRYPLRYDIRKAFSDDEAHLPAGASLPRLLRNSGYATAHVGKWHLGGLHQKHIRDRANSIPGPHQHGFDHYLCQNEEQPRRGRMGRDRTLYRQGGTVLIRDERNVPESDPYFRRHFTDINGDESVRLVEKFHAAGKPFFLNLWFLDPHMPYEPAPEPFWTRAAAPGISENQRCARSMILHMDHKIGQLLAKLEALGIRKQTLILFTSDNGGAYEANIGPYRGGKTDLHEGGIRVPGIVSWPSAIRAGAVSRAVAHHCDILPTVCEAAGVTPPRQLDGISLLRHLKTGAAPKDRGLMFWQIDAYGRIQRHYDRPEPHATEAARLGRWKLMARDGVAKALYDLDADPLESANNVGLQPDARCRRLRRARDRGCTAIGPAVDHRRGLTRAPRKKAGAVTGIAPEMHPPW